MTASADAPGPSASAEERFVLAEPAELPVYSADVWTGRYVPRGILVPFRGQVGTPAPYALDAASLVVRRDGELLHEGADYLVDPTYGTLCLPVGELSPVPVTLDYRYTMLRLDSIMRNELTGARRLARGVSHLTSPHPPRPEPGEVAEANVLIDANAEAPRIFAIEAQGRVPEGGRRGRLPLAAARLADGEALRLLFLGDSITEGGDASTEDDTFRAVAVRLLQAQHSAIEAHMAATGGSRSAQWLDPEDDTCDWGRVVGAEPHVTVVEFLNDAYLAPDRWTTVYDELVARLRSLGSEVVILTPTFAMRAAMGESDTADDGRPYVGFLREYADRHDLPLIDVSARWEGLRDEGLPYWTLLANGINHPDDRGHRLTGEFVADALSSMLAATAES